MKTIKTPVRAFGGAIWDRDGHIASSCNAYTQSRNGEIAAELARVLNSHDALVEALTQIANGHAGGEGAGFDMQEIAQKALKLAEGGK